MSDISIKKIIIAVGKKEIELSYVDAVNLYYELGKLFKPNEPVFVPYQNPHPYVYPYTWVTTTSSVLGGTDNNFSETADMPPGGY